MAQAAQRSWGCPIPVTALVQAGWGFGHLLWREVTLTTAVGWDRVSFKVLSNTNHPTILGSQEAPSFTSSQVVGRTRGTGLEHHYNKTLAIHTADGHYSFSPGATAHKEQKATTTRLGS